jgi:hypothetical protein
MASGWNLKSIPYFMGTTHEPLHLDKWSFLQWRILDIHTNFIESLFSLAAFLNAAVVRNFEVMLGQTLNHFK